MTRIKGVIGETIKPGKDTWITFIQFQASNKWRKYAGNGTRKIKMPTSILTTNLIKAIIILKTRKIILINKVRKRDIGSMLNINNNSSNRHPSILTSNLI